MENKGLKLVIFGVAGLCIGLSIVVYNFIMKMPQPKISTDYNAIDYDSVTIVNRGNNFHFETTTSGELIEQFFSAIDSCDIMSEEEIKSYDKFNGVEEYALSFRGKNKAEFVIYTKKDGSIYLSDQTFNITLQGKRYECKFMTGFVTKLRNLMSKQ